MNRLLKLTKTTRKRVLRVAGSRTRHRAVWSRLMTDALVVVDLATFFAEYKPKTIAEAAMKMRAALADWLATRS